MVGLRGSAIEIDSKKGSASQKGWEPLPYTNHFVLQTFYFWNGKELNTGVQKFSRNIVCYLQIVGARV